MSPMAALVDELLGELFRLDPVLATDAGLHDHDSRWPDPSAAGDAAFVAFVDRWTERLGSLDGGGLSRDDAIDRDFLLGELDALRFATIELRELDWDPLAWIYLIGGGLFPLVAREFAPLADRLRSLTGRFEGIPALVGVARRRLGADPTGSGRDPSRPVSRLHAETAIRQVAGVAALIDDAVALGEATEATDPSVASLMADLRTAASGATAALGTFSDLLVDTVLPAAEGDGRLGSERFAAKLRRTLRGAHPTPAEVLAQAEREYGAVRAEMVRLARELWPVLLGDAPIPGPPDPAADERTVRAVLDAIAERHGGPDEILDFCRAELARIEAFCREHDLVGLPDEPLAIEWTPEYLRAGAGAMLIPPGPLDRGEKAFFAVTPVGDDWPPERVESWLREGNDRMLRLLTIHEAVPGHYLQLAWANRCASLARVVLGSGVFAEGWAVYVTQVLIDLGYGADDPALLLTHWKFYLRSVTNAIIDVRIHTAGMTEEEALELMVRGGFQEEAEARAKYDRARLTSTQLSTYFVGSMEMWRLERDRRVRLAAAATGAAGPAVVPESRLVGGLGETPGFRYREHLELVLSFGSPPIPILRRLVLDG